MTAMAFGEHLRREREMRGVSLEEISAATRISTRFLEALEGERWEQLPGGIFNRGFIRAVAHFLGLDEESLVAEYALATDDKPSVAVWATTEQKSKQGWLLGFLATTIIAALLASGWYAYQRLGPRMKAWRASKSSTVPPPASKGSAADSVAIAPSTGDVPVTSSDALDLKVEAGKPAEVKVTADGTVVFSGQFTPGESRHFRAKNSFEISSSEASALLLELNGQIQPPLGPPGQPGTATLGRKDLKRSPGGHN